MKLSNGKDTEFIHKIFETDEQFKSLDDPAAKINLVGVEMLPDQGVLDIMLNPSLPREPRQKATIQETIQDEQIKKELGVCYEYIEIPDDERLVGFHGSYFLDRGMGGLQNYWISRIGIITSKYK